MKRSVPMLRILRQPKCEPPHSIMYKPLRRPRRDVPEQRLMDYFGVTSVTVAKLFAVAALMETCE